MSPSELISCSKLRTLTYLGSNRSETVFIPTQETSISRPPISILRSSPIALRCSSASPAMQPRNSSSALFLLTISTTERIPEGPCSGDEHAGITAAGSLGIATPRRYPSEVPPGCPGHLTDPWQNPVEIGDLLIAGLPQRRDGPTRPIHGWPRSPQ